MDGPATISLGARRSAVPLTLVVIAGALVGAAYLGNGTTTKSHASVEARLSARTKVTAIAAGCHHSLALAANGQVLAWGANASGQLGDGKATENDVPVQVSLPAGTAVAAVAAGCFHSLALTMTGQVLAWGENAHGQLGDGNTTLSRAPLRVKLPAGIKAVAVAAGCFQSLALTSTGQVLAWGQNATGELGDGTTTQSDVPVKVRLPAGTKATAIAAGCFQGIALTSTDRVLAWGDNAYGELGNGNTSQSDLPAKVKIPAGAKVTAIAGGGHHSLALTATGRVLAWGEDATGQLGDGKTTSSDVPVDVKLPAGIRATAISGGGHHSLALTSTGQVLAWGENGGQLGTGNTTQSDIPVDATLPPRTRVVAIAAGGHHSLALTSTDQLPAWGDNESGELGDANTIQTDIPVKVRVPK